MIEWLNGDERTEGRFKSSFFSDDSGSPDLYIYIENASLADHAEKCVESFNDLSDKVIIEICKGIYKCAEQGGENEDFELPRLDNVRDILEYCWFTAVYVRTPEDDGDVSYIVEGEGDWGEVVGFVIENDRVAYVGTDYFDYPEI